MQHSSANTDVRVNRTYYYYYYHHHHHYHHYVDVDVVQKA